MDDKKLELVNDLHDLIEKTRDGLEALEKARNGMTRDSTGGIYGVDKTYNLCVCEYTDGSGFNADLSRYIGNTKLLDVIIAELASQLSKYEEDYAAL